MSCFGNTLCTRGDQHTHTSTKKNQPLQNFCSGNPVEKIFQFTHNLTKRENEAQSLHVVMAMRISVLAAFRT